MIDSTESLEILRLLRRSQDAFWAPRAIAEKLGLPAEIVSTKLELLRRAGLVTVGEETGAFRYCPRDQELAATIAALVNAYSEHRS